jgi:hypothetical protein
MTKMLRDFNVMMLVLSLLVLSLVACSSREQSAEELKHAIAEKAQELQMKSQARASFEEQATWENCKVGAMSWYRPDGYTERANAILCKGEDSSTITRRVRNGKSTREVSDMRVVESALTEEEIRAEEEASKKQEALKKLSEEEKKLLGLK